jgi:FlaA1/EpsC-like NDP-sugar epimerase
MAFIPFLFGRIEPSNHSRLFGLDRRWPQRVQEEHVIEGLGGKTALITGGAGGIGSTISEALLEGGVQVFLHDLPTSDGAAKARSLCQRFGDNRAVFVGGDLNDLHSSHPRAPSPPQQSPSVPPNQHLSC